jgi:hypothetical protein
MDWHVQYRRDGKEHVVRHISPEDAIEAACVLIDDGFDVHGLGTGPLVHTIDRDRINAIYNLWAKARHPFGR